MSKSPSDPSRFNSASPDAPDGQPIRSRTARHLHTLDQLLKRQVPGEILHPSGTDPTSTKPGPESLSITTPHDLRLLTNSKPSDTINPNDCLTDILSDGSGRPSPTSKENSEPAPVTDPLRTYLDTLIKPLQEIGTALMSLQAITNLIETVRRVQSDQPRRYLSGVQRRLINSAGQLTDYIVQQTIEPEIKTDETQEPKETNPDHEGPRGA